MLGRSRVLYAGGSALSGAGTECVICYAAKSHSRSSQEPATLTAGKKEELLSEATSPVQESDKSLNRSHHNRRKTFALAVSAVMVILAGAIAFWHHARTYESTDNAQVDGHLIGITARIDGTVHAVYVEQNQFVKASDVVAEIDSRDYVLFLKQAQAQLLKAEAETRAESADVLVTDNSTQASISGRQAEVLAAKAAVAAADHDYAAAIAGLHQAEAHNANAQADLLRYKSLVDDELVSRVKYDEIVNTANALAAAVDLARSSAESTQNTVGQRRAILEQARVRLEEAIANGPHQIDIRKANLESRRADVQLMKAQVDRAMLDVTYCKILATVSGVVSMRTIEVGEHVDKGRRLLTIADLSDLWVTANFKETQLGRIHPGQPATIYIDAYGQEFDAYVEAMPGATGAIASLLPPENATGNFVKVVQRLPVRLRFKRGQRGLDRLRPGLSGVPTIRVR